MRHLPLCLILPAFALAACNFASDGGGAPAATVAQADVQSDVQSAAPAGAAPRDEDDPAVAAEALTEVLSLEVAHPYFADGRCSTCRIAPTAETAGQLRQAGAAVRTEPGRLSVVAPSDEALGAGDRLDFEVQPSDPQFAAYTAPGDPVLTSQLADVSLAPGPSPGAWRVEITPGGEAPVQATVGFSGRQAHWRWIVLLGEQADSLAGWTVRRESAPDTPVDYDPPEATDLQDGRLAWQITLRAPLPLREHQPADQIFMLVPPPGAESGPIRLPSPAPDGVRASDEPGRPTIAEIFVFL